MNTWQQTKETMAVSDRLNQALRALNERHIALANCHGVEGLTALVEGVEALVAANGPKVPLPGAFDTGRAICSPCPLSQDEGQ